MDDREQRRRSVGANAERLKYPQAPTTLPPNPATATNAAETVKRSQQKQSRENADTTGVTSTAQRLGLFAYTSVARLPPD